MISKTWHVVRAGREQDTSSDPLALPQQDTPRNSLHHTEYPQVDCRTFVASLCQTLAFTCFCWLAIYQGCTPAAMQCSAASLAHASSLTGAALATRCPTASPRLRTLIIHRPAARRVRAVASPEAAPPPSAAPSAADKPKEVDHVPLVLEELKSKKKVCIAQTAPAVRIAIGEDLGLGPGVNATGKMVRRNSKANSG